MDAEPALPPLRALAAIVLSLAASAAAATDGDLDPTFGTGGYMLTGAVGASYQLPPKPALQPDGKVLVCSIADDGGPSGEDFFVARLDRDGALDPDFDFDGRVSIDFDARKDDCNAIALQADGKILVVGSSQPAGDANSDFAIARLEPDGSLDPTFGAGSGKVLIPFDVGGSHADVGDAVAVQADGRILVGGWANTDSGGDDFAVVRLMPDGTRDTTFHSTGRVTIAFDFADAPHKTDESDAIMIDASGRIVVSGIAERDANGFDFAVARLLANGTLDASFSADGRATIGFDLGATGSDVSYHGILDRQGRIVLVGTADTGASDSNPDLAVARLLPDGSADASFGLGGKVVVPFDLVTNGGDVALDVVEDAVGRLAVVGVAAYDQVSDFQPVALRLLADGNLDHTFGAFGKKTYDFGTTTALFTGVVLQGTQLLATGLGGPDDLVARLEVDLLFANGFD